MNHKAEAEFIARNLPTRELELTIEGLSRLSIELKRLLEQRTAGGQSHTPGPSWRCRRSRGPNWRN